MCLRLGRRSTADVVQGESVQLSIPHNRIQAFPLLLNEQWLLQHSPNYHSQQCEIAKVSKTPHVTNSHVLKIILSMGEKGT